MSKHPNLAKAKRYEKRSQAKEVWIQFRKNKGAMLGLIILVLLILGTIAANVLLDYDTHIAGRNIMDRLQGPSMNHLMGTDEMGRDLALRIIYGARYSLVIGFSAVLIAVVVGVPLGAYASFYGGKMGELIMRLTDILASVPSILMAVVIVSALGHDTVNIIFAIGLCTIPELVRITRAAVLTVRDQEYVEAARAIALTDAQIIFQHVLPNCLSPILVQIALRTASSIITASALSYLGFGVLAPAPEWGAMLSAARNYIRDYNYMCLFPGLAIMLTVLSLNLVGDGLRDAMDPKLRR